MGYKIRICYEKISMYRLLDVNIYITVGLLQETVEKLNKKRFVVW